MVCRHNVGRSWSIEEMSPITHFLLSWGVANTLPNSSRRDRAIVTLAGVAPDFDGIGIVAEVLTRKTQHPLHWWSDYHHVLGHNVLVAAVVTGIAALLASSRRYTALLACLAFHLHLLCDVLGSRGPDGYQWPIPYLLPFSSSIQWTWHGQWALNAWPNCPPRPSHHPELREETRCKTLKEELLRLSISSVHDSRVHRPRPHAASARGP
jgi:inner membrane protein